MTKAQVISEVLAAIRTVLDEKLEHEQYSQYLKGSLSLRLDLIPGPEKRCVHLDLPPRGETPKPLQIEIKRKYTRRQCIELPPEMVEEVHAE